ncbi:MAG: carboxymuconolactone decarboxylase family protein [Marinobacter sp.]|uniref:carboxymuconolactone decarboxylase family protein n=1 Tax=Marinobacter sp. TaxID=50741 RepID=UPI00329849F4
MSSELFEKGLNIRREVLGDEYVDNSLKNADEFSMPLQELATEFCWGAVWGRETLSKQQRSVINLAMISALNRPHELALHLRGALNNGLSREEIREILLQVAVYCGIPAGIDSFRIARQVLAEYDAEDK